MDLAAVRWSRGTVCGVHFSAVQPLQAQRLRTFLASARSIQPRGFRRTTTDRFDHRPALDISLVFLPKLSHAASVYSLPDEAGVPRASFTINRGPAHE